jgi:DNA-directed RNA polymerase beta subunit/DNA-directed RNA polymerase beta' subunit
VLEALKMAHFSPEEAFEQLKTRTTETIKNYFPIEGKQHTLVATKVWIDDEKSIDDIRSQKDAKIKGRSWTVPIKAEFELKDNVTGKVIDRQVVSLAQLPKITSRYTYIVNGNEWQVNNLFRMKSGVYTRIRQNGELTSQWNLAKGKGFDMDFDPSTQKMTMRYENAHVALYPVLKTLGVDDDTIERAWGKDIFNSNKSAKDEPEIQKLYRSLHGGSVPESLDHAKNFIREEFGKTVLRPDSTKLTLGKPYDVVNGDSLLAGATKILKVSRQEVEPDDRDSLPFKELHSAEDLINEKLERWNVEKGVKRKISNTLDKNKDVRAIINPDIFGKPLRQFFTSSVLSERQAQTNPLGFISGNRKTTLFAPGEGGIQSTHEISLEAESINPSHLGFLDPIQTPECFDAETEVFTSSGWKKWPDITDQDLLACRVEGRLEFHAPERIVREHYQGVMYGLEASKINYLVTPNHRVYFSTPWSAEWKFDTADRVHGKERRFITTHLPFEEKDPVSRNEKFALPLVEEGNAYPANYYTTNYNGMVYCATVPGSLLYVRRKGSVGFWSGNSERIGTTLQLASHVVKVGHELKIPVFNFKTGKKDLIDAYQALKSNLAFPDQYLWKDGKPTPITDMIKVSDPDGTITVVKSKSVDYALGTSKGMFDLSANLIPFLQNNQGNRTMVASRQLTQSVALKNREAPLVQTRSDKPTRTFEQGIGKFISHSTLVAGVVDSVKKDAIVIKSKDGKHEVQLYDDFPMNDDKSVISSTPLVKPGDKVTAGQIVADTNFTTNGVLSLGVNLRTAYMPWKGYNFEDGVVMSETAAKKLTSDHMYRENIAASKNTLLNKKKFLSYMAGKVSKDQSEKLDDDAVIKEGQVVNKDDILLGVLKEEHVSIDEQKLGLFSKGFIRPWKPREVRWTKDNPGVVTRVVKHGKNTTVYIRTEAPAIIGDKIAGRHGNKGVCTLILPDHEMPQDKDGNPVELVLNPTGLPTRINLGQALETAASKIAEKTGKPYVVNNFDPKVKDYTRSLQKEMVTAGVSDTEDLFDPVTKRKFSNVLTGKQYILKLHHTAEKGLLARSRDAYDSNMLPSAGGAKSGQTLDAMGLYALLAHNARENIREAQTIKADMNDQFWTQLQAGDPIPTPKVPFVFKKFEGYLKGMGLDIRKEGNDLFLQPLTDAKTLAMSSGAIPDAARALRAKDAKEEVGGLFDPKITGGAKGKKWSHIALPERMPNPVFEKPVSTLLGLNKNSFNSIVMGDSKLNGKTGPAAIIDALESIDTKKLRKDLETGIPNLRANKLDSANKRLKYLRALDKAGMTPTEAYTMKHLPVLPPVFRPFTVMDSGDITYDDVNALYANIGKVNLKFKDWDAALPPEEKLGLQSALYDGLKALTLIGNVHQGRHRNAIMQTISGSKEDGGSPKTGFFQSKVIGKRQDLSMRGVIIPEPSLSLDEVGLPRKAAAELYKPFVVRKLVQNGQKPLEAQDMVKRNHPAAISALEAVISERPILLKRDPVLHKFGVMAFRPRLVEGRAIKIHPLVTGGFNADFDGDKMAGFVPVSSKAVKEAYKMLPSNNLFSPTTGLLMSKPTQESMMGLYKLTEMSGGNSTKFSSPAEAAKAVRDGKITVNDMVSFNDLGSLPVGLLKMSAQPIKTTIGRLMVYQSLPENRRDMRILTDPKYQLDKKNLHNLLTDVAKNSPKDFGDVADRFKDLGNEFSTGMSIGLSDFLSDYEDRDRILKDATKKESEIRSRVSNLTKRKNEIVKLYIDAAERIDKVSKVKADNRPNRMNDWVKSGARGSWSQFKQMTVAPILVADSRGNPVPVPIPKSYSEGLDIGSYFASMHGARMGTIGRVQGTQEPGIMSKQLVRTMMNQLIVSEDCGTTRGVMMPIDDQDVLDRFTVEDIKLGSKAGTDKGVIPAGSLVTTDLVTRLRNNKINKLEVRSPLKCAHGQGMCSKCYGLGAGSELPALGTNVGVMAAQALGEPATQLSMNCNASGNLVTVRIGGKRSVLTFEQLWDSSTSHVDEDQGVETKIPLDLEVWDHDRFTPVYAMQRHKPHSPMVMVRTETGHSFITQDTHPNWVRGIVSSCQYCGNEDPVGFVGNYKSGVKTTVRCASCRKSYSVDKEVYDDQQEVVAQSKNVKGMKIGVSFIQPVKWKDPKSPLPPYLLGMALAEGNVRRLRNDTVATPGMKRRHCSPYGTHWKVLGFDITQNDGEIREEIKLNLDKVGVEYTEPSDKVIQINDVVLSRKMWSLCGIGSSNKRLPAGWESATHGWIKEVLAGLLDGDGTSSTGANWSAVFYTTSWSLASQVMSMVRTICGYATSYVTTNKELTRNQCFAVSIKLPVCLPSVKHFKIVAIEPIKTSYPEVVQVKEVMYDDWTYDLATESRAFTANGVRTHNSFHTGGVVGAKGTNATSVFNRLKNLLDVPKILPGSATLSDADGKVDTIDKDPAGGSRVGIGEHSHYVPASREILVKKGDVVKRGDALSSGPKNPREMLERTNINAVQNYLTEEIWNTYKNEVPVRRRNIETYVRAATNLGIVTDPGDHDTVLKGDPIAVSEIAEYNRHLKSGSMPVKYESTLQRVAMLPQELQTDWLARMQSQALKTTILDAAANGWKSSLHGTHPIPGMAFGAEFGAGTKDAPWLY